MGESLLPQKLGPFEVRRQIATGASSTVYEALNSETGREVALKVFHAQLMNDPLFSERLKREADTLKMVRHPNVVQLINSWNVDGRFFLELELVQGRTFKEWCAQDQGTWIEPLLWILAQTARAVGAVHEQHVLHRDLKPDNVLISNDGTVKLTDFGLARSELFRQQLTQTGSLVGSLAYMAPETIEGQRASYASDIFSFGVIAYELLCNRHPFHDDNGQLQLHALLSVKFQPLCTRNPRVPSEVGALIDGCLRVNEAERPSSIYLVEAQLMDYLQRQGLLASSKGWVAGDEAVLANALSLKNQKLKSDIEKALTAGDRKVLVSRIGELRALFPDDQSIPTLMNALAKPPPKEKSGWEIYARIAVVLILISSGISLYKWAYPTKGEGTGLVSASVPAAISQSTYAPESESTVKTPEETKTSKAETLTQEVEKPAAAKAATAKPIPLGALRILTDADVQVFVDGRELTRAEAENYKVKPGRHRLKLVKAGFDPIEQPVTVRSGRTATVNARAGGQP